jgi:NTE family protein
MTHNQLFTILTITSTKTKKRVKRISISMSTENIKRSNDINSERKTHRALVLQGGVALGAYEAGVVKTLSEKLMTEDEENGSAGRPVFDIIAGTSAGAINAAILVSYVKENRSWKGAAEVLQDFWMYLSTYTPSIARFYGIWLGEAARRYYSSKYFFYGGIESVFTGPEFKIDNRFHDYLPYFNGQPNVNPNTWFFYDNEPLKKSLEHDYEEAKRFVKFPLATSFDKEEPRLLTITVDVQEGATVTFDSYEKRKDNTGKSIRETTYGKTDKSIVIKYNDGIKLDHVMASASFPIYFKYQEIDGRQFWDGGILSNTPLRELLQAHRDYWKNVRRERTPDLDVYVINVWPGREEPAPSDYDGIKDRKNDIMYGDKSEYDQKVGIMVGDYIDLFFETKKVAFEYIADEDKQAYEDAINNLLNRTKGRKPKSRKRSGNERTYADLIDGRFKLNKVVTIERKDDPNSNSDKWADFSTETIDKMIEDGENYKKTAIIITK